VKRVRGGAVVETVPRGELVAVQTPPAVPVASVRAAVEGLGATLDPPSDVHASADYRRSLAETSTVRAVLQAAEKARG
jgi:CO/xanthine dehydrogenase FAD-binding subunit